MEALQVLAQTTYPDGKLQLGEQMAEIQLELKDTQLTSETWTGQLLPEAAA